ncbi:MAG: rhodanese-like domain-containing protein [Glaciimonas sp.]|nr:rhodanese-like domain-containing protein [Glaciimonas sp.]
MKFILENISLFGLALFSGGALLVPGLLRRGSKVSLLQATQIINQGKALILDVREPDEFAAGHLRDAKNISQKILPSKLGEIEKFKSKPVIVVCATGTRSASATARLKKAGFSEAVSLDGGMTAWQAQSLPTVK